MRQPTDKALAAGHQTDRRPVIRRLAACRLTAAVVTLLFAAGSVRADFTIVVAADGTGDCLTIQDALVRGLERGDPHTLIRVRPGDYTGPFYIGQAKARFTVVGEDPATTRLLWPHNVKSDTRNGPPAKPDPFNPGLLVKGDDVRLENLTIANTSGEWGQGLAAKIDGDRFVAKNCRFLGWQDTLMVNAHRQYFVDCYIEGRVDFIFGSGTTVFDRCTVHSKNGGYVTAASTPAAQRFGFVFLDCKLTADPTPWDPATTNPATTQRMRPPTTATDLGRPWRPHAAVAFVRCDLGGHINPGGWNNWRNAANEQTARFAEYRSTGPGANPAARVPWARQLTDAEAADYTVAHVLAGTDGWDPQK